MSKKKSNKSSEDKATHPAVGEKFDTLVNQLFRTPSEQLQICKIEKDPKELGFLQPCMERRFHRLVQEKFEELSGLQPHDYWIHADAGGAPKMEGEENRAQYAYKHGARIMGWSAHGAGCGGFKPPFHPHTASDDEIQTALVATLMKKVFLYPEAKHYAIFVTENGDGNAVIWWRGPVQAF
jgi:hypothetical protein